MSASTNDIERKVQVIRVEESPFSMSEEDTPDSLEIKPPQASSHKSHSHRSYKEKHSSHRSQASGSDTKSNGSHKSHHRSRHREERDRRHYHKEKSRESSKASGERTKSSQSSSGDKNKSVQSSDRESSHKSHRHRDDDRKHRDERKTKDSSRHIDDLKLQEADLRAKLDRKKFANPFKEKEKLERELRKERFLEAERVKEAYKERVRDVEQKRKRYRTSSRSPVKPKNEPREDGSPPASRSKKEMEDAGLVVLTDESRSPTPQRETPPQHAPPSPRDEEMKEERASGESDIKHDSNESENSSSEDDSEDSSSDTNDDDEDTHEESDHRDKRYDEASPRRVDSDRETSPHIIVSTNTADIDMEIELEKDTLPPYLPAIQGCRSVEEFKCLNRIEEGTYGVVYRAKDKRTEEIVALKRLKMEKEKEGFPITSLREINTLLKAQHPNIVTVREIVVGSNMDKIFIVMDYVEHDIKSLMETMKLKKQVFMPGEVKCLMQQLLNAVAHLHDNWILHRDLKTSNLLLSHKGILKVGDFGLAREYGSPLKHYTPIVVTLWYRSPELLLGCKEYSTPIDIWSVGCIFAEFLAMEPLFPGKSDLDQLNRIFKTIGTPNEKVWTGFSKLPAVQKMSFAEYPNTGALKMKLSGILTEVGHELLMKFLTYDPVKRITAEEALKHDYFTETPLPIDPAMFPTWPAKSELGHKKVMSSPKPPSGGQNYKQLEDNEEGFHMGMVERSRVTVPGFSLKF